MTLDQLEMIEAIVEEGSYQAAARKIHKSQPSLTNGVKKVEELYGIKIFSRAGYRPKLTMAGKQFFEQAKITLANYRGLHKLASDLGAGIEPEIKVAMDPIVLAENVSELFNVFKEYPHTSLKLESEVLFDNAQKLIQQQVDFAIGHFPLLDNQLIEKKFLCEVELIPVISASALKGKKITKDLLQTIPNIVVRTKEQQTTYSSSASFLKWIVDGHDRKRELVEKGMGWGRLPMGQVKDDMLKIPSHVIEPIQLEFYLMRHREKPYGPVAQKIWSVV